MPLMLHTLDAQTRIQNGQLTSIWKTTCVAAPTPSLPSWTSPSQRCATCSTVRTLASFQPPFPLSPPLVYAHHKRAHWLTALASVCDRFTPGRGGDGGAVREGGNGHVVPLHNNCIVHRGREQPNPNEPHKGKKSPHHYALRKNIRWIMA
jgi:hypothetical protein